MRTFNNWVILAGFVVVVAGCESKSESKSYEFELNGCNTGKQTFESTEDYCAGLQDYNRNRGCAYELREQAFKQSCAGEFTEN